MTDQPSEPPVKREAIILKELDHIQAIMARFDTFFFLMKQVCLAGIAGLLAVSAANKLRIVPFLIWLVPLVFFILEVGFRFSYWSRYVDRVATIRDYIQSNTPNIELYVIVKPQKSYCDKARWFSVLKFFDMLYYGVWTILALIVGCLLVMDQYFFPKLDP